MGETWKRGSVILALLVFFSSVGAFAQQIKEDPLYEFATAVGEIVQVNLSIWRIVYVLFEVFALIFVFLVLPVIVVKIVRWGLKEVFK